MEGPQDEEQKQREELDRKIDELKKSKFKQQMLPAWRPVPSFGSTMITFGFFGVVFLGLGIMLYVLSDKIQEKSVPYDQEAFCGSPKWSQVDDKWVLGNTKPNADGNSTIDGQDCTVPIILAEKMTHPVFVYYQLDNFYQNHRRYVKSRDYLQLMGENRTLTQIDQTCDPITKNVHLENMGITHAWGEKGGRTGPKLNSTLKAVPCGLIAKSFFNDSYELHTAESSMDTDGNEKFTPTGKVVINETNIAWASDKEYKFHNQKKVNDTGSDGKWYNVQWTNITNEHFIVWMRTAGLPNFRKLWGRIDTDLEKGTYLINIKNEYVVAEFSGKKYFVLSTTNMLGGRNYFLAICYIVVGSLCIVFAIIFFAAYMRKSQIQGNANQPDA